MDLPFDELRFNILFCVLTTLYGISGLGRFFACIPGADKEDAKFFQFKPSSFNFRLITSLTLLILGIIEFQYPILVFLTLLEIIIIITLYVRMIISKQMDIRRTDKELKITNRQKIEEIKDRLLS